MKGLKYYWWNFRKQRFNRLDLEIGQCFVFNQNKFGSCGWWKEFWREKEKDRLRLWNFIVLNENC